MTVSDAYDFSMERRLNQLDPILHRRFTSSVFALQHILSNYKLLFPQFTDHTELHTLNVIDFSNRLIGAQIERMNADEIYTLLMGAYLHDTGMGITEQDYEEFSRHIDFGDYFDTHPNDDRPAIIRDFHNEFSGLFIRKYRALFDFPSDAHMFAVIQTARGHRKTDMNELKEYPVACPLGNGNTICLPYLSARIRLADEIDITAARNPVLLYDMEAITGERDIFFFTLHKAVKDLLVKDTEFIVEADASVPAIREGLEDLRDKMQKTLDVCREAVNERTPYRITQETVRISYLPQNQN